METVINVLSAETCQVMSTTRCSRHYAIQILYKCFTTSRQNNKV